MNRRTRLAFLLGVGLVLWAVAQSGLAPGVLPNTSTSEARQISSHANLTRVIDADTIVVGSTKVRLDGIAAPEMEHRTYSDGRQFMVVLLREATLVECDLEGRMSHDREVGRCFFVTQDGQRIDPQAEIVKAGLARDCPRYSGGKYNQMETTESKALPLPTYCEER
ncbi:thermonuclease family protein [Roseovarius sp. CAU 1744]|uniref:thermonuclease family protein n=1 Tax=Roseovarius sp. CAU 1744 TaxID=3140368 RepID=UPI00325AEB42